MFSGDVVGPLCAGPNYANRDVCGVYFLMVVACCERHSAWSPGGIRAGPAGKAQPVTAAGPRGAEPRRRLRRRSFPVRCRVAAGGRAAPRVRGRPSGRKHGQAPACPSRSAARPHAADGRSPLTREKRERIDVRVAKTEAKITRNDYEEVSTVSGEPRQALSLVVLLLGASSIIESEPRFATANSR